MPNLPALLLLALLAPHAQAAQSSRPAPDHAPDHAGAAAPDHAAAATPAWKAAIAQRRQELVAQNGPGTDTALRDRLLAMRNRDQAARGLISSPAPQASAQTRVQQLAAVDLELTSDLKQIVAANGWPTIALVGIDASDAAMLLLTHTSDHTWQASLLPHLEQLADDRKIDAAPLALVIDKESVAAGRPQRYGSQFKFVNGHMAMYAVEDPGNLDQMRARAMLPPMDAYKQILAGMYGLKVGNDIVMATPPAHPEPSRP